MDHGAGFVGEACTAGGRAKLPRNRELIEEVDPATLLQSHGEVAGAVADRQSDAADAGTRKLALRPKVDEGEIVGPCRRLGGYSRSSGKSPAQL
jgi:hypothetical protein